MQSGALARADLLLLTRLSEFAFSTTAGVKPIVRTLAAQGVSREIRGHLQSRGLSGVQAPHDDGHD